MNPIIVALIFNVCDVVSGILQGIKNKTLSSSVMREGLFKKCGYLMCYWLGYLIQYLAPSAGFEIKIPALNVIITYVITAEILSIIENIHLLNEKILPEKLSDLLGIKNA